ncbi:MAG: M23 family metallopeptidase, partial [Clostridia bacterium]|nr:M23 family metallopeptidase [Clostridia bacterium]
VFRERNTCKDFTNGIDSPNGKSRLDGIDGKDGSNGIDGKDGKSAYEIWLDNGHEGTESDFLEWLKATAPVCEHTYSEWSFVLQPSCTAGGVEEHTCESCGNIEYRFTQARGHKTINSDDYYDINDTDYHIAVCSECGTLSRERHQFDNHTCTQCKASEYVPPITDPHYFVGHNEIYKSETTGFIYRHRGIDFTVEAGTEVYAMADGIVEAVNYNDKTGNDILVNHGNGLKTLYRYVEPVTGIAVGETVKRGQVIATVAEAYGGEAKDGAHLHFEVSVNGNSVDPLDYFDATYEQKVEE